MDNYVLKTPGKINLFLEIKGQRPDSRHEILTLYFPVWGLSDQVGIVFGGSGIQVHCTTVPDVPQDRSNLAVRAAEAFYAAAGRPCPGISIQLDKRLPVAGGMGGGSSDAGAVLRLLQKYSGVELPRDVLEKTALSIGSDVPYFLNPVPAIGRGGGEQLFLVEMQDSLPILLVPGCFPISAAWAYRHWKDAAQTNLSDLDGLLSSLVSCDYAQAGKLLRNDLEPAALQKFPLLKKIAGLLRGSGGFPLMSGSGSSMFALYPDFPARIRAFDLLASEFEALDLPLIKI